MRTLLVGLWLLAAQTGAVEELGWQRIRDAGVQAAYAAGVCEVYLPEGGAERLLQAMFPPGDSDLDKELNAARAEAYARGRTARSREGWSREECARRLKASAAALGQALTDRGY